MRQFLSNKLGENTIFTLLYNLEAQKPESSPFTLNGEIFLNCAKIMIFFFQLASWGIHKHIALYLV